MLIKSAEFVTSNTEVNKLPAPTIPEFAFIGRSNVGKSSLINAMTNKKGLAKTSQKPGKTQLINHFLIDEEWYLVDLPGYGYAQTSKKNRADWGRFIRKYLTQRQNLQCVFVLIDSRLEPQKIDLEFCCWLGEKGIPFMLAFTKGDKQSTVKSDQNMAKFKRALLKWFEEVPKRFLTSSETKSGVEQIVLEIQEINKSFVAPAIVPLDHEEEE